MVGLREALTPADNLPKMEIGVAILYMAQALEQS